MKNKQSLKGVTKGFRFRIFLLKLITPPYKIVFIKLANFFLKVIRTSFLKIKGLKKENIYLNRSDNSKLRLLIYKPKDNNYTSTILWLYSGGFLLGSPESEKVFIKLFAKKANMMIVIPDYVKSYKKAYPHQLNDSILTLKYLKDVLKLNNVSIGGASAGGNLATALSLYNRDNLGYELKSVISIYPMLDYYENKRLNSFVWNSKQNRYAWESYLKNSLKDKLSYYESPSLNTNFESLPPYITYIGTNDLFYEETIKYINNLKQANVKVSLLVLDGAVHGIDYIKANHNQVKQAHQFIIEELESLS